MPICSYIVQPRPGSWARLIDRLKCEESVQLYPSDNREMLVVVTDTRSEAEEKIIQSTLSMNPDIACMSLVYAHQEENIHAAS